MSRTLQVPYGSRGGGVVSPLLVPHVFLSLSPPGGYVVPKITSGPVIGTCKGYPLKLTTQIYVFSFVRTQGPPVRH